jgi:thiol-disulfide isomerase/thioredoxin
MKKHFLSLALAFACHCTAQAAQEGQSTPDCPSALTESGDKLALNAIKNKVVLIDFWATWCPPCQKSMPFFNELHTQYLKDGFEIVAINVDEDSETAREFLKAHPVAYKTAFDPSGDCPGIFDVKAMPSSYLVDKTGKIRQIHLGFRDEDQAVLREQISALLAE